MKYFVLFALILSFSLSVWARPCTDVHMDAVALIKAKYAKVSDQQAEVWDRQFADYSSNVNEGLGVRAYFGDRIPKNPISERIALKHGLVWWRIRFYMVESVEAAIQHRAQVRAFHEEKQTLPTDITAEPVYMIGREAELGVNFSEKTPMPTVDSTVMRKLLEERQVFEVDGAGQVTMISKDRVSRFVTPEGFFLLNLKAVPDAFGANGLSKEGWVAFKQHGIHDYNHWKGTSTANKLRKLSVKLAEQGFTVRFNHNYEAAMDMILQQQRSFRTEGGRVNHALTTSRYMNTVTRELMLAKLRAGLGYSVEVYSPEGKLVAGEIGVREGNHLYGDTVFYDTRYNRKEHGFDGVDLAKVAADALFEVLGVRGQPFSDPGMITPYTASLGAELVPFREWHTKIKSGPREPIVLPNEWSPLGAEYFQKVFGDMAKRRNQGIGRDLVMTRATAVEKSQSAVAEGAKVFLGEQPFVVVPSVEAAQTHVSGLQGRRVPIYIVAEGASASPAGLLAALQNASQVVTFKNPKYSSDVLKLDAAKLASQLRLESLKESEVAVVESAENPTFQIEVWRLVQ